MLTAFNSTQQFLITLLCEYHEEKIKKTEFLHDQAISSVKKEERKLKDQILTLKVQISQLCKENNNLESKLHSAENMIRILMKNNENHNDRNNTSILNTPDFEHLFQEKLNGKSNNRNYNNNKHNKPKKTKVFTNTNIQNKPKKDTTTAINKNVESGQIMKKALQPSDLKAKEMKDLKTTLTDIQQNRYKKNDDLSTRLLNNTVKKEVKKPTLQKTVKVVRQILKKQDKENRPPFVTVVKPRPVFILTGSNDYRKNEQDKVLKKQKVSKNDRFKLSEVPFGQTYIVND